MWSSIFYLTGWDGTCHYYGVTVAAAMYSQRCLSAVCTPLVVHNHSGYANNIVMMYFFYHCFVVDFASSLQVQDNLQLLINARAVLIDIYFLCAKTFLCGCLQDKITFTNKIRFLILKDLLRLVLKHPTKYILTNNGAQKCHCQFSVIGLTSVIFFI